jgi:hypothetical protein
MTARPVFLALVLAGALSSQAQAGDLLDPLVDTPVCQGTGPAQGGGDDTYPTCLGYPDLTLDVGNLPGMSLGGSFVPWNGSLLLSDTQARTRYRGRCAFAYSHFTVNAGAGESEATLNAIYQFVDGFPVLASSTLPALSPGYGAVSSGTIWLPPGTTVLAVKADAANVNGELDEANNVRLVQVTVRGTCN